MLRAPNLTGAGNRCFGSSELTSRHRVVLDRPVTSSTLRLRQISRKNSVNFCLLKTQDVSWQELKFNGLFSAEIRDVFAFQTLKMFTLVEDASQMAMIDVQIKKRFHQR